MSATPAEGATSVGPRVPIGVDLRPPVHRTKHRAKTRNTFPCGPALLAHSPAAYDLDRGGTVPVCLL